MSIKRIAIVGIFAAALTLTACTGTGNPNPTGSTSGTPTPTPAATAITGEAPADEAEAIDKAEAAIELLLATQTRVSEAGGTDTAAYETVATGNALRTYVADAEGIANGPTINEDGDSIEGPSTVEGSVVFEPKTAYGQEYEEIANGLVIVPGCLDGSGRKLTTADGKPAMTNPNPRNEVEFHVVYNADTKSWLVDDRISLGTTC